MKKILTIIIFLLVASVVSAQTILPMELWKASSTPLSLTPKDSTKSLSITGNATSTFNKGINLTGGGCFAINGTCLTGGGSMTYPGAGIALSTGAAWDTSITNNSGNWNTAYGWGNHATVGYIPNAYYATTTHPLISSLPSLSITKSQVSDFGTYESVLTFNYPLTRATNAISTVATSSLNLLVGSFLSPNISQWTNDSNYITSAGVGTISTSTTPLLGGLAYWTSAGYPSLLGTVATGTISSSGGVTVTAGRSAIGGSLAITCTAADTNNTGCLSDTDWDTFNGKQATISATWPIIQTGATLSFGGLSTSSAAVISNIPYFSNARTFANVATTTLTATAPMALSNPVAKIGGSNSVLTCTAASGSVAGCLSSANWTTFNTKISSSSISAFTPLTYNPTSGVFAMFTSSASSAGFLTAAKWQVFNNKVSSSTIASYWDNRLTSTTTLSKLTTLAGVTTVGTIGTGVWNGTAIDISGFTNLAAGRSLTLSGDSVETDTELYTSAITFHATSSSDTSYKLATTTNAAMHRFSSTITITKIYGSCNQGTTTVNFDERTDAAPNTAGVSVFGAMGLSIGSTFTNSSSTVANTQIDAGDPFVFQISDASPTGNKSNFCDVTIQYTKDD